MWRDKRFVPFQSLDYPGHRHVSALALLSRERVLLLLPVPTLALCGKVRSTIMIFSFLRNRLCHVLGADYLVKQVYAS